MPVWALELMQGLSDLGITWNGFIEGCLGVLVIFIAANYIYDKLTGQW